MNQSWRPDGEAPAGARRTVDLEREVRAANTILRARVKDLADAQRHFTQASTHIRNLEALLDEARARVAYLDAALALQTEETHRQADGVRAANAAFAAQAEQLNRQVDAARASAEAAAAHAAEEAASQAAQALEYAKLQAAQAVEQAASRAAQADAIAAAAQTERAASAVHAANLQTQIATVTQALDAIRTSTSWRLTGPLRAIVGLSRPPAPWRALAVSMPCTANGFARSTLTDHAGPLPCGWTLFTITHASGAPMAAPMMLRVDCADGRVLACQIAAGARGPHLFRLPDTVAALTLETETGALSDAETLCVQARCLTRSAAFAHILRRRPRDGWRGLRRIGRGGGRAGLEFLAAPHMPDAIADFERWTRFYDTPTADDLARLRVRAQVLADPPRFSVVTPVYNTPPRYLREMIASVRDQAYPHWELCLADDASPNREVRDILSAAAAEDARIRLEFRKANGNISAASNSALALANGSHLALLDHDDVLPPHALAAAAKAIANAPRTDIFYSDEDKIDDDGRRFEPYFKPDWNEELIYAQNYANHLTIYRAAPVRDLGGFRLGYEGSQDYDLLLRVLATTRAPIVHIPHILYHWRIFQGAGNFSLANMRAAAEAARRAIREKFASDGVDVEVLEGFGGYHRLRRPAPRVWPKVSVIIPTRDHADVLRACITGLLDATDYPDLEVLVIDNGSEAAETFAYFKTIEARGVRILPAPGPFNFSRLNNLAARAATGEVLLLLNNDISMLSQDWLKEMVIQAVRPEVGAVGARLLYPDGTVQHGGVILGIGGVAGHVHVGAASDEPGYFARLKIAQEMSCVTAACLVTPRAVFEAVGGLDEDNLAVAFNDVDYCVRVREAGYKIIWTPHAELTHWESKSRGSDQTPEKLPRFQREVYYMRDRWGPVLDADPYYNPNLDLYSAVPRPAFPPRVARPWA